MLLKTLLISLALALGAGQAQSEPMDLQDVRARWVSVRFERSPEESPGQLDSEYSPPFPAWFEAGPLGVRAWVVVDAQLVEQRLMRDEAPVPGSFSDFVWEFDVATGHVTSARLSGSLSRPLRLGFLKTTTEVRIRIDMSTLAPAGFRSATTLLGNTLYRLCEERASRDCTLVDPQKLDRQTGYVNAVGALQADSAVSRLRTFSPLGEAVFTELPKHAVAAGPGASGRLLSRGFNGSATAQ